MPNKGSDTLHRFVARPGWFRGAFAAVALILAGHVLPARAELQFGHGQIALSSGPMRLAALREGGLNPAEAGVARQLLRLMGYGAQGLALVRHDLRLAPILTWDPNINGGFADATIQLGGLDFILDPRLAARSGVVAGARVTGSATLALGGRWALDGTLAARYSRGLTDPAEKSDGLAALCLRRYVGEASEIRACATPASPGTRAAEARGWAQNLVCPMPL